MNQEEKDEIEKLLRMPKEKKTFGQKSADWLTSFVGSWTFIIFLFIYILVWVVLNLVAWFYHWDPWPFIILNLTLSCLAAVQAPIILMSENREAQRDRRRAERDYFVDRRTMKEILNMQQDLDEIKQLIRNLNKKQLTKTKEKKK